MEHGAEGEHARGQLGGGIGVGQASPDGSARPRLEVPDERRRLGQERSGGGDTRVALEGALADERAKPETSLLRAYRAERGHAVEVYQHGGTGEPHVHHGYQALAARQRLGVRPVAGEELQRLVDRARGEVLERGRSHAA